MSSPEQAEWACSCPLRDLFKNYRSPFGVNASNDICIASRASQQALCCGSRSETPILSSCNRKAAQLHPSRARKGKYLIESAKQRFVELSRKIRRRDHDALRHGV